MSRFVWRHRFLGVQRLQVKGISKMLNGFDKVVVAVLLKNESSSQKWLQIL